MNHTILYIGLGASRYLPDCNWRSCWRDRTWPMEWLGSGDYRQYFASHFGRQRYPDV